MIQDAHRSDLQNYIWDIMKVILKFMEKEGTEYYMLGGTLLGAVRHKGFIPWDDDIDIGIPRGEYERFLSDIKRELPDYMAVRTYKNSRNHHYYFSRIVDKRYKVKRTGSEVDRLEEVWVDIFPLDGMPNRFIERQIHKAKLLASRVMYHVATFDKVNLKRPNRPYYEKVLIRLIKFFHLGKRGNMYFWLNTIDRLLKKYPYSKSDWCINFMGQYMFREMFPKEYYGNGRLYDFEECRMMGPENAHAVLSKQYGDYMKFPKDADRNTHASVLIVK
jgi:lipopolysaccharide cholinephosphotransferase